MSLGKLNLNNTLHIRMDSNKGMGQGMGKDMGSQNHMEELKELQPAVRLQSQQEIQIQVEAFQIAAL